MPRSPLCRNKSQSVWCKKNPTMCSTIDTLVLSYLVLLVLATIGGITWGIVSASGVHTIDSKGDVKIPETVATFLPAAAVFQLATYRLAFHYFCEEYVFKNYSLWFYLKDNMGWLWVYILLILASLATIIWGAVCLGSQSGCVLNTNPPVGAPVGAPTSAPVVPPLVRFENEIATKLFNVAMVGYGVFGLVFASLLFLSLNYFGISFTFSKTIVGLLGGVVSVSSVLLGLAYLVEYPPQEINTDTAKLILLIAVAILSSVGFLFIMNIFLFGFFKLPNKFMIRGVIFFILIGLVLLGVAYANPG